MGGQQQINKHALLLPRGTMGVCLLALLYNHTQVPSSTVLTPVWLTLTK